MLYSFFTLNTKKINVYVVTYLYCLFRVNSAYFFHKSIGFVKYSQFLTYGEFQQNILKNILEYPKDSENETKIQIKCLVKGLNSFCYH